MSLTGDPDGPPTKSGLSLVDLSGGYVAAIAMLAGLYRARRDGVGCDCDVSLFETALSELVYVGTWAATHGLVAAAARQRAHPSIVPFQAFATADGCITVACAKQRFWGMLCTAMHREDLLEDPRYIDFAARDENRDELLADLARRSPSQPTATGTVLVRGGRSLGPSRGRRGARGRAGARARGRGRLEHPELGTVRQVASPLRLSAASPPAVPRPLPR